MFHRLLFLSSAISLLLCAASITLWIDSYRAETGLDWTDYRFTDPLQNDGTIPQDHYGATALISRRGKVWLSFCDYEQDASGLPDGDNEFKRPLQFFSDRQFSALPEPTPRWRFLGFWYDQNTSSCTWQCGVPTAALTLLTAVLPALYLLRRRRGICPNFCVLCGYDLRASLIRCPECGTPLADSMAFQSRFKAQR
jgi:hypothetical protein